MSKVKVIGAGLAGSEAALQLADRGVQVELYEMRPTKQTPAHHTGNYAELVCSNSLKSMDGASAAGILKYEMTVLGSRLMEIAFESAIPAGKALAVDRDIFSQRVTDEINAHPNIEVVEDELTQVPTGPAIIATGPLTSDTLAASIQNMLGTGFLSFYDAAAPIVSADSINRDKVFAQSRYGKGGDDYLNAPFDKDEYEAFQEAIVSAEKALARDFDSKELFSACQPVEEIARTGKDALRYGPLKPVGLVDPRTGRRPWAVVQLRCENSATSAYNLVGFQTNLKFGEQERVFRMIPGLEEAEFLRYGVMHRNTFIDSPHVLNPTFEVENRPGIRFAGQITGTEGYCEAIASGLYTALATLAQMKGVDFPLLPTTTVFGSLVDYATNPETKHYQPMHVNFGILQPLENRIRNKQERYLAYASRAREQIVLYRDELQKLGLVECGVGVVDIPQALVDYLPR